jgi:hypothetical protein
MSDKIAGKSPPERPVDQQEPFFHIDVPPPHIDIPPPHIDILLPVSIGLSHKKGGE